MDFLEISIGNAVLGPFELLIVLVVIMLIAVVYFLMRRQKRAATKLAQQELATEAGQEVPLSSVRPDQIQVVIKPVGEALQYEQFSTHRFLIFTKPNIAVSFNVFVNGVFVQKIAPGHFEYTFEQGGEQTITATVVEVPQATFDLALVVEEIDYTSLTMAIAKEDGTSQTSIGYSDNYYVEIYPQYPLKINVYVDEQYYTQVQGGEQFQCYFNNPGEHTMYGVLENNQGVYTDYLRVVAVDESQGEEAGY